MIFNELKLHEPTTPDFAARVDVAKLSKSGITTNGLRDELTALRKLQTELQAESSEAHAALLNLRALYELGESDAKAVESANKHYTDLQEQLKRLESQAESVSSDIVAKESALRVVQRRFEAAVDMERQKFFEERSQAAKAIHDEAVIIAKRLDELQIKYGSIIRQLQGAGCVHLSGALTFYSSTDLLHDAVKHTVSSLHHTGGGSYNWHYKHRLEAAKSDDTLTEFQAQKRARTADYVLEGGNNG